jgi:hypothetical protein
MHEAGIIGDIEIQPFQNRRDKPDRTILQDFRVQSKLAAND